jgi:hypothetical protein
MSDLQSWVYLLCMLTSLVCLFLLARGYQRTRVKLLFWASLCFVGLAINNLLLFADVVMLPTEVSLLPVRHLSTFLALSILLYGFIWETD